MITKTIYKCEICGQVYETEREATICENSHVAAESIITQTFHENEKYPCELLITMGNGHRIKYGYIKPIVGYVDDKPYFTGVGMSREAVTNHVVIYATGAFLPENDEYSWEVTCDNVTIPFTSEAPTITFSEEATHKFDTAGTVKVKVWTPKILAGQYVIK